MALGRRTNNYAELNNIRILPLFAIGKGCQQQQIFVDYKIIMNSLNQQCECNVHSYKSARKGYFIKITF